MAQYRTKDGDVLDAICTRHYNGAKFDIVTVYEVNPGLADHGPVMPAGLIITLPDVDDTPAPAATVRLWD